MIFFYKILLCKKKSQKKKAKKTNIFIHIGAKNEKNNLRHETKILSVPQKKKKKKKKLTTFLLFFLVKSSFKVVKSVDTFMGHTLL